MGTIVTSMYAATTPRTLSSSLCPFTVAVVLPVDHGKEGSAMDRGNLGRLEGSAASFPNQQVKFEDAVSQK